VPDVHQAGFAGKTILVIGSGYSAITTCAQVLELKKHHPNTQLHWFTRRATKNGEPGVYAVLKEDILPQRLSLCVLGNELAAESSSSNPRARHQVVRHIAKVEEIQGGRVRVHYVPGNAAATTTLDVDHIVSNCGYRPDTSIARELQVHYCWASDGPMNLAASLLAASGDCLAQVSGGADLLKNPEPNFFVLGGKSYGRNSSFLMKLGIEQVATIFDLMMSKM
jgi:thioredoxin reductase